MEERPRFDSEQPEDTDAEVDANETPRRVNRWKGSEKYWSRLFSEASKPEERSIESTSETDDEDEEDDDGENSTLKRYKWYRNIKPSFKRLMLNVEKQDVNEAGGSTNEKPASEELPNPWLVPVVESEVRQPVDGEVQPVPAIEADLDLLATKAFEADDKVAPASQEQSPEDLPSEPIELPETLAPLETYVARPEAMERPQVPEAIVSPVVDEPESIQTILRRQVESMTPQVATVQHETAPVVHETTHNYSNANTGLHLLNYALARRRDNKNMAATGKEFKRVDKELDEVRQKIAVPPQETKINKQRIEAPPVVAAENRRPVVQEVQRREITNDVERATLNTVTNVEKPKIIEQKPVFIDNRRQESAIINQRFEAPQKPEAQEVFMQKVAETVEAGSSIGSEFAFERRHEVKDDQGQGRVTGQSMGADGGSYSGQSVQNSYSQPQNSKSNVSPEKKPSQGNDYRQAATSGAWGAVVGVIMFVIFYILTNR